VLFIDSTAIAKGYSCVSQPFFIARLALWNTVGLPGGFITFLWVRFIPKLEAPADSGAFFIVLVSAGTDFSEPEIDHFVMSITSIQTIIRHAPLADVNPSMPQWRFPCA